MRNKEMTRGMMLKKILTPGTKLWDKVGKKIDLRYPTPTKQEREEFLKYLPAWKEYQVLLTSLSGTQEDTWSVACIRQNLLEIDFEAFTLLKDKVINYDDDEPRALQRAHDAVTICCEYYEMLNSDKPNLDKVLKTNKFSIPNSNNYIKSWGIKYEDFK